MRETSKVRNISVPRKLPRQLPWLILPGCVLAYLPIRDAEKAYDYSGNGWHGTYNNVQFSSHGRFGFSRYFTEPGTLSYISVGNKHVQYISICAWVKPRVLTHDAGRAIAGRVSSSAGSWLLGFPSDTTMLRFRITTDAGTYAYNGPGLLAAMEWHFFVNTFNGHKMRWYRNGKLTEEIDHPYPGAIKDTGLDMHVSSYGSDFEGNNFYGWIDEIQIYNRALTDDEIKLLYEYGRIRR